MKLFAVILTFFLACAECWAQASTIRREEDIRRFADGFMSLIATGNNEEDFKRAREITVFSPAEMDELLAQLNSQLPQITSRMGRFVGFEHIRDQRAGESLLRSQYVSKHEKAALRWEFMFYNTPNGWVLLEF